MNTTPARVDDGERRRHPDRRVSPVPAAGFQETLTDDDMQLRRRRSRPDCSGTNQLTVDDHARRRARSTPIEISATTAEETREPGVSLDVPLTPMARRDRRRARSPALRGRRGTLEIRRAAHRRSTRPSSPTTVDILRVGRTAGRRHRARPAARHWRRDDRPHAVLASAARRAGAVRRVPACVQAPRRPARVVLRARPRGRRGRAHDVRPLERLLRRPDREEAAEPLPARLVGAVVRHRRLQPRVPLLPELGHLEVEGDRHARRRGVTRRRSSTAARGSAAAASRSRTTTRRSSWSTRSTSPTRAATPGIASVAVTAGYICPEPRREFYAHMDAANVDLKALHRGLLPPRLRRHICATCSTRSSTSCTRPTCGSRSRTCSSRARTTPTKNSTR